MKAAFHALKSYEHGNASPELAADIALKLSDLFPQYRER